MAVSLMPFLLLPLLLQAGPALAGQGDAWSGPPTMRGETLPENLYVEIEVWELKNPEVLWIDRDWLRARGYAVAEGAPIPAAALERVKAEFGWSIRHPGDPASAFTGRKKSMWVDIYGGDGVGANHGSGRAASQGDYQVKGIGITPLRQFADLNKMYKDLNLSRWSWQFISSWFDERFTHSNGRASIEESLREAVHSRINAAELPHGSNAVVAILKSGLDVVHGGTVREDAALIVREDPLRPAHLLRNQSNSAKGEARKRLDAAVASAWKSPPWKAAGLVEHGSPAPPLQGQTIHDALFDYATKIAEQFATARARGIVHGAPTPSNVELSGRALDFGTQTYNRSFRGIRGQNKDGAIRDGDAAYLYREFIEPLRATSEKYVDSQGSLKLPSRVTLSGHFQAIWNQTLRRELLLLTGIPPIATDTRAGFDAAEKLGASLQLLTEAEARITETGSNPIDTRTLLLECARATGADLSSIAEVARPHFTNLQELERFAEAYVDYRDAAFELAAKKGVSREALELLVIERARRYAAPRIELERNVLISQNRKFLEEHKTELGKRTQAYVDGLVERNLRFEPTEPFEAVLSRGLTPDARAARVLRVFDALSGKMSYRLDARARVGAEWRGGDPVRMTASLPMRTDESLPSPAKCVLSGFRVKLPFLRR